MTRRAVAAGWFPLAELGLVAASGALWLFRPQLGGWPLSIALLPALARLAAGRLPFRRTPFDLPLAIFLATAALGVWAAYDRQAAWGKFWVLLAAALLYYALAAQPGENLWFVGAALGLAGAGAALFFLLFYDWRALPADLGLLRRFAAWWASARPGLPARPLNANAVSGALAVLLPFPLALGLRGARRRESGRLALGAALAAILAAAIFASSSRGAWLALAGGLGTWLAGGLALRAGRAGRRLGWAPAVLLPAIGLALAAAAFLPGGIAGLAGSASGESRLELARSALQLIEEVPFTGGGLRSFPGLYSQYVRITPHFQFAYSHNLYLDLALEQGAVGGLALLAAWLGAGWLLAGQLRQGGQERDFDLLRWAALAALLAAGLHGLVDDALYGEGGTPLLLALPGAAAALQAAAPAGELRPARAPGRKVALLWAALAVAALAALLAWRRPLQAAWCANLGALAMARAELAGWPSGEWRADPDVSALAPARRWFERSLALDPGNPVALYRLGLIALQGRDFTSARQSLEQAYRVDGGHRGLRKSLGYARAWSGQLQEAAALLATIPEAEDEMTVYAWWWRKQGRPDLARRAKEMAGLLHRAGSAAGGRKIAEP